MSASMLGGPVNAAGAIMQGQMTSSSLQNQANLQTAQAAEAESAGQYNATRESMLASQKIGTSVAAYGASGVSSNSGSVQDVLAASAANSELDRLNILHGADVKATNYSNQAALDRYGADSALLGSQWQAMGDLTGGAIQGASNQISSPTSTNPSGGSDFTDSNSMAGSEMEGGGSYAGADAATGAATAEGGSDAMALV